MNFGSLRGGIKLDEGDDEEGVMKRQSGLCLKSW